MYRITATLLFFFSFFFLLIPCSVYNSKRNFVNIWLHLGNMQHLISLAGELKNKRFVFLNVRYCKRLRYCIGNRSAENFYSALIHIWSESAVPWSEATVFNVRIEPLVSWSSEQMHFFYTVQESERSHLKLGMGIWHRLNGHKMNVIDLWGIWVITSARQKI